MTEYLEGSLSPAERVRFERHITGCADCRLYLTQLSTTTKVLRKLADEPIPEPVQSEILEAFRNWKSTLHG